MLRNPYRLSLCKNRPGDGLSNPPGGVSGKLCVAAIVKLVNGSHQAQIPLLNQIEKVQLVVMKFLGNRHYQSQIRFNDGVSGLTSTKRESFVDAEGPFEL